MKFNELDCDVKYSILSILTKLAKCEEQLFQEYKNAELKDAAKISKKLDKALNLKVKLQIYIAYEN